MDTTDIGPPDISQKERSRLTYLGLREVATSKMFADFYEVRNGFPMTKASGMTVTVETLAAWFDMLRARCVKHLDALSKEAAAARERDEAIFRQLPPEDG